MNRVVNLREGQTLYIDDTPILTVRVLGKTPYKATLKLSEMIKARLGINDIYTLQAVDQRKEQMMSVGDVIRVKPMGNLSVMITGIKHTGKFMPAIRLSCKSEHDYSYHIE